MNFDKNLMKYTVLQDVFNMRYEKLSQSERNEIRSALLDLGYPKNLYNFIQLSWNGPIVTDKLLEICDKLLFNDSTLYIKKTRCCGMTNLLLTYLMWVCLYEEPKDNNREIWYIAPYNNLKDEYNRVFRTKISILGNRPEVCNKREVKFNGWRIHFFSVSSGVDSFRGNPHPHLIIMDECDYADQNDLNKFINLVKLRGSVKMISASSDRYDEINQQFYFGNDKHNVSVNWFHDIDKRKGLRFENCTCGIKNIMKIDDTDIEQVIGNTDYLKAMYNMGWHLESDWLDDWIKNTDTKNFYIYETISRDQNEDQLFITKKITEIVIEKGLDSGIVNFDNLKMFINLFNGCNNMADVDKVEKTIEFILELKKQWEKDNNKPNNEYDVDPCIRFLRDIFKGCF